MNKFLKKNDVNFILTIFIVSNPFIDLLVSLSRRFTNSNFSIASVIRGLCFGVAFIYCVYLVLKSTDRRNKLTRLNFITLSITLISSIAFLITRPYGFVIKAYIIEINEYVRFLYFPFVFLAFLNLDQKYRFDRRQLIKSLKVTCSIYSLFVVIPYITNTGFNSYVINQLEGSVGWLYGANEIGMIIGILTNLYLFDLLSHKITIRVGIELLINFVAIILLGTKAPLVLMFFFFIVAFVEYFKLLNRTHRFTLILLVTLSSIGVVFFSPAGQNVLFLIQDSNPSKLIRILLSGRLTFLDNTMIRYRNASVSNQIFGIGFMFPNKYGRLKHEKFIEMDVIEVFLRYGVLNLTLIFMPFIITVVDIIRRRNYNRFRILISTLLLVIFILSFLVGHVASAPSVSLYVSLLVMIVVSNPHEIRSLN